MRWSPALAAALLCAGCASPVVDEADRLARAGDLEGAYATIDQALQGRADDPALRTAHAQARDRVAVRAIALAELALAGGRRDEAARWIERLRRLDAGHARLAALDEELARTPAAAPAPAPARPAAPAAVPPPAALGPAFSKPVTLEFRDAPLRQVFESLARSAGVNFVFDKDVRADARITVFLRGVSLDEAIRVMLATQQLDRKLLNERTVFVYPNTSTKQREHQELVTRTVYLVNADAKQAMALVRTMAKTRDVFADERLNALVVRDTPEVVRHVEQLLATIDLPDPEVTLAVEVLEVASDRLDELGLSWPAEIRYGLPESASELVLSAGGTAGLRGRVANPALVAALSGNRGSTNLLANPTIRARQREKAKVQIGEKFPVFTTTAAANVGVSSSVSYLDVGLKLEVEPLVQLDGDVVIKVALEVSNLLRAVSGPQGALAYQIGTRLTTTSLRLRDGQTQVLAGLISDEDRQRAQGVPGLSTLPLVGRLFGVHGDTRNKTEIVMLITPRIVRQLPVPPVAAATLPSGTDSMPGAPVLRIAPQGRAGVGAAAGGAPAAAATAAADGAPAPGTPEPGPVLLLAATAEAAVGETVSVTLANRSALEVSGELQFDPTLLQGRGAFTLAPGGETALVLRVLPAAAGQGVAVTVGGLPGELRVEGEATVRVRPAEAAK